MQIRPPKDDDQEQAERALIIIKKCTLMYPEIEATIWITACLSAVAASMHASDMTYEEYCGEMTSAMKHYKTWWDDE